MCDGGCASVPRVMVRNECAMCDSKCILCYQCAKCDGDENVPCVKLGSVIRSWFTNGGTPSRGTTTVGQK